ncbi:MAG TPA: ABC transporter permease [Polyangia bacterium]|nr:ABC transporter permease [Polyangia bacterium]
MKSILPPLWATLIALAAASALIIAVGGGPLAVYRLLLAGTWGNGYGIGQVLFKTTPLIFTGLSVALALRAGLFNIGAEGQLTVGAFATAMVGLHCAHLPAVVAVPLALVAGALGGALVGAIAGALKAWRGAHEVINTIMLNFIVRAVMVGVGAHLFEREQIHTAPVAASAELPRLSRFIPGLHGSAANASLFIAVAVALAAWWLVERTRAGFRLRAVGASPDAAATSGISVPRVQFFALALSGAVAGLVGANFVLGYKHYYEDGFSGGIGYMGIAVAVLGRSRPLGVVLAALLFGTLSQGALAVNAVVPKELVDVMTAVIIFSVAAAAPSVRRRLEAAA